MMGPAPGIVGRTMVVIDSDAAERKLDRLSWKKRSKYLPQTVCQQIKKSYPGVVVLI